MRSLLFKILACPLCKTPLSDPTGRNRHTTASRSGSLLCARCGRQVGVIRFGKADFIRHENLFSQPNSATDSVNLDLPFLYKRIPWNSPGIYSKGLVHKNGGWTPEGYGGSLFTLGESPWELIIETDASDVDLRLGTGPDFGMVELFLDGIFQKKIFLRRSGENSIDAFPVCRNRPAGQVSQIIVRPPTMGNPSGKPDHFCFSGFDAAFVKPTWPVPVQINRGNRYPDSYAWGMNLLPPDGLALDCGSGDRTYGDPRLIGFEYLPFELPDVYGDGHALPFCDNSFDIVFSQAVMEHMCSPFLAAQEIARVLKPGGMLYAESAFMQPLHAVPFHFFNTTPWGIRELFKQAGLQIFDVEWFGPLSGSVKWYLDVSGSTEKLSIEEMSTLMAILGKADAAMSYSSLMSVASGVALWGIKPGDGPWMSALSDHSRPTYRY